MLKIIDSVVLSLSPQPGDNSAVTVVCSQGDYNARQVEITLEENDNLYCPGKDDTLSVCFCRSDGKKGLFTSEQNVPIIEPGESGKIILTVPLWLTKVPGLSKATVSVLTEKERLSAQSFFIFTNPAVLSDREIESSDEVGILSELTEKVRSVIESSASAVSVIEGAVKNAENITSLVTECENMISAANTAAEYAETQGRNALSAANTAAQASSLAVSSAAKVNGALSQLETKIENGELNGSDYTITEQDYEAIAAVVFTMLENGDEEEY